MIHLHIQAICVAILESFVSSMSLTFIYLYMCILTFPAHYLHAEKVKGVIRVQITEEKQSHKFWEKSPVYNLKIGQAEVIRQREEIQCREANLNEADYEITSKRQELEEFAICAEEQASIAS